DRLHLRTANSGNLCRLAICVGKFGINTLSGKGTPTLFISTLADGNVESVPVNYRDDITLRVKNGTVECPNLISPKHVQGLGTIVDSNSLCDISAETNTVRLTLLDGNTATLANEFGSLALVVSPTIQRGECRNNSSVTLDKVRTATTGLSHAPVVGSLVP